MERFIPYSWCNSDELHQLCLDLDLIPESFCTPSMLEYWKERFNTEFTDGLDSYTIEMAETYRQELLKAFHKRRYSRAIDDTNRQLKLNF